MHTMTVRGQSVNRENVGTAYREIDVHRKIEGLPRLPRDQVLPIVRRVWRRAVGKAWPGKWKLGRGNHRSYPRHKVFLVNPDQGWQNMLHDMSHHAHLYLTRQAIGYRWACSKTKLAEFEHCARMTAEGHRRVHTGVHARLERDMIEHARELIVRHGVPSPEPEHRRLPRPSAEERLRHAIETRFADRVAEANLFRGDNWIDLKPGWRNHLRDPVCPLHTIHENTVAACFAQLRGAKPCDCEDCISEE